MRLSPSQIAVKKITSSEPRSKFNNKKIEKAAHSIVAAEGIINPLVVRRTGLNSYELVDGGFEYHAAARAREIDLARGEMVAAYIIDEAEENESILKEQLKLFRQRVDDIEPNTEKKTNIEFGSTNKESETNTKNGRDEFRSELKEYVTKNEFKEYIEKLENKVAELKKALPQKIEPLQTFNEASEIQLVRKLTPVFTKTGNSKQANNFAKQIIKVRKEKAFESLAEVIDKINGLGQGYMLKILDRWLYSQ